MKQKAVGFYWTLPVPWAGFQELPEDVDAAAGISQTIAFQRALTRRYAKENGMELVHETALLELRPDGGSKEIDGPLKAVAKICREQDAVMLYTDFAEIKQWRGNQPMMAAVHELGIKAEPVAVSSVFLDGREFHPHRHFADWRERQTAWTEGKSARVAAARARALELKAAGMRNPDIAHKLNDEDLRSATGKRWTADSLRKTLAADG